ncbi:glutathione S-transferase family protein [Solimonas flava]|uniref:glutathione S-transferase family protein n=1 Tax=Solimonas flava TaxID=415849 RepID=UPI0003FEF44B|nr:glutathione S-transferase family protein [Solimonas flava]
MSNPELWQMRFSMYPEKARWALDHKRVPHVRRSLLPGPHAVQLIARFGQKAMPILRHEGKVLKNSAAVLDYVERTWPDPPLYPTDPVLREQALELQKWFDEAIGPAVRRAGFYEWLPHTEYSARRIATGLSEWQQKLYAWAFPAIRAIMMLDMKIDAAGADAGRNLTREALDFVAEKSQRTGYLVGDQFSVADLTAATILMPTCLPPEFPVHIPRPLPPGWAHWLARWQGHAGCEYVRRIYREHRGISAALGE